MATISLADRLRLRARANLSQPLERHALAPLRRLRNARREIRPIFIAGASGSGTSFLTLALAERFECAGVVYEVDAQISRSSFLAVPAIERFASVAEYRDFIAPRDCWSVEEGRRDLLDVCRGYCTGSGDRVLVKGPDISLVRIRFLARCFPAGEFVLIFRDPVANVEGYRRKWSTFGNDSLEATTRFYHDIHEFFLDAAEELAPRVSAVDYEALVAAPEGVLAELAARLGLSAARRRAKLPTAPNIEGRGARNVRNNRVGVVANASERARTRLDESEVSAIEAALGPIHRRLREAPFTISTPDAPGRRGT